MAQSSDSRFSLADWGAIWAVVVIWGVNNAAGKLATAVLPPLLVGGVRFAVALAFLFPFIKPPFPDWRSFAPVMIVMGPLHFGLVYWGFALAHNLSLFSVSLQLWIPLTALFSWLILGEAMPRLALAGMGLAFVGVAYMTLDPGAASDVKAVLVGLAASTMWALGTVLVRRLPPVRALKVQGCVSLVAAPVLLAGAFLTTPHLLAQAGAASPLVWASIVYAGLVSSVGATVALFWLVQRREAGRFTPYLLTTPLVSAVFGVGVFGDVLTWRPERSPAWRWSPWPNAAGRRTPPLKPGRRRGPRTPPLQSGKRHPSGLDRARRSARNPGHNSLRFPDLFH